MNKKIFWGRSLKDILFAGGPVFVLFVIVCTVAYRYMDPAPPSKVVIATGEDEGDYQAVAEQYRDLLKADGVSLEIRPTAGPLENLRLLEDDDANVDIGFVQDGLGSTNDQPDLVSLGSLYYEPLWFFYRGAKPLTKFSELKGKKIAVGFETRGTHVIALPLLKASGVNEKNTTFVGLGLDKAAEALKNGQVDGAFFILTADDPLIDELMRRPDLHLMDVDQAEAIARQTPALHHLVLPHGTFDLAKNIPDHDINLVSPTATLLVRDDLHPAIIYLLLKAASKVHGGPGIFEKRDQFPANQDNQFPISPDAKQYYKSGGPFWQRYMPFWLAAWIDRFILFVIPTLAIVLPLLRTVPKLYQWRIRRRILKRYGELKFLETQIQAPLAAQDRKNFVRQLDAIEQRVNQTKVPLMFADHVYSLRGHIQFVRDSLNRIETHN